jgi:hypothetical protein
MRRNSRPMELNLCEREIEAVSLVQIAKPQTPEVFIPRVVRFHYLNCTRLPGLG